MKIEKIYIQAYDFPDWDYCIDQMIDLADKMNEIIEYLNTKEEEKE